MPEYDDISFYLREDDDPSTSPEDDLPAGFSAFHQRFPAIVSPHFPEAAPIPVQATADDGDLQQRIDTFLETLIHPRR